LTGRIWPFAVVRGRRATRFVRFVPAPSKQCVVSIIGKIDNGNLFNRSGDRISLDGAYVF
jgi:hypothetical protein